MKKYIQDMNINEIFKLLSDGNEILSEDDGAYYKIAKDTFINVLIKIEDGCIIVNPELCLTNPALYFDVEESFKIKETGVYKTSDGKKVFVTSIDKAEYFSINGVIENTDEFETWTPDGRCCQTCLTKKDIIGKWEE